MGWAGHFPCFYGHCMDELVYVTSLSMKGHQTYGTFSFKRFLKKIASYPGTFPRKKPVCVSVLCLFKVKELATK